MQEELEMDKLLFSVSNMAASCREAAWSRASSSDRLLRHWRQGQNL